MKVRMAGLLSVLMVVTLILLLAYRGTAQSGMRQWTLGVEWEAMQKFTDKSGGVSSTTARTLTVRMTIAVPEQAELLLSGQVPAPLYIIIPPSTNQLNTTAGPGRIVSASVGAAYSEQIKKSVGIQQQSVQATGRLNGQSIANLILVFQGDKPVSLALASPAFTVSKVTETITYPELGQAPPTRTVERTTSQQSVSAEVNFAQPGTDWKVKVDKISSGYQGKAEYSRRTVPQEPGSLPGETLETKALRFTLLLGWR